MRKTTFKKLKILFLIPLIVPFFFCLYNSDYDLRIKDLQCNNMVNPLGVEKPLLSWKIYTAEEGIMQSAWEIEIASDSNLLVQGKTDIWKSGKQVSDQQFNIEPFISVLSSATQYFWRVRIWDNKGRISQWSSSAHFTTGLLNEEDWEAKWITSSDTTSMPLPYFYKTYEPLRKDVSLKRALVFLSGLGNSELYINGIKIDSTRLLDPAQTNYDQYAFYSSFDVTNFLKADRNIIGVLLGNGWFSQQEAWNGASFSYGKPMFRLQLIAQYSDNTNEVILISDENWKWIESPILKTNIYLGETYDARKEIKGWPDIVSEGKNWENAISIHNNHIPPQLKSQPINPIRKKEVIPAQKMWQDSSGNWIFDFGVNKAGIPYLETHQPQGTSLSIRIAEEINEDSTLDFSTLGWKHHGKIFEYKYICKGKEKEKWSPRFVYHGFRYAEISGLTEKPDLSTLKMIAVNTDVEQTGYFECSNSQINKLHKIAVQTVLNNLHGIPTDCPNREKCGWLGDTHAYVKMANLNFQMNNFWSKYLEDIHSGAAFEEKNALFHERYNTTFYYATKPAGIPYMVAPGKRRCGVASPDWGTAVTQLPWWLYVYYGNKKILEDFYPDMKLWTDYVSSLGCDTARINKYNKTTKYIIYQGLGDWCPPKYPTNNKTPVEFTSTAFHYLDVSIMENVARILNKNSDAEKYTKQKNLIANEMGKYLFDPQKNTFGSQTADVMALDFNLVPNEKIKAVADVVVRNMDEVSEGFMNCGIFGLSRIGSMLARHNNSNAAWKLFSKTGENSFEWMLDSVGATTLWETLPINKLSQQVAKEASHNHAMQAGYDVFFYEDIAGIRPDPSGYGFKVIRFDPLLTDYLSWAKGSIESPYGTIVSSWENKGDEFRWQIKIPPNSSGLVALPTNKIIIVNDKILNKKKYIPAQNEGFKTLLRFPSGNFYIKIQK